MYVLVEIVSQANENTHSSWDFMEEISSEIEHLTITREGYENSQKRDCSDGGFTRWISVIDSAPVTLPKKMDNLFLLDCRGIHGIELPERLPRLVSLGATDCQLHFLPFSMPKLRCLLCKGNNLQTLPRDLNNLTELSSDFTALGEDNQAPRYHSYIYLNDPLPGQIRTKSARSMV